MLQFRKILVPTDFSGNAKAALAHARELAKKYDAEVLLVHVLEPPVYPAMTFGAGAVTLPALQDEMRSVANEQLDKRVAELKASGVNVRGVMREGSPFAEIVGLAAEEDVDLIAIATHGHTGLKHLLLGSTTEKVVRKAACPVLTVRVPE